tara:strand:- start:4189 stop:5199 length:1011 start_codon:yes stop_codon:yes gene_type:complete
MANTIRIKKRAATGAVGAPTTLAPSELAFNENTSDLKLYYGYGDNGSGEASSVIAIGGSGAFFNKTDTRTANTILSGPTNGDAAAPTFRALVAADIPSIAHTKISDFDTGVQANTLDQLAAPTSAVAFNSQKITGLATCSDANDGANKAYVDSVAQGLDVKDACKVATTANITLANTQTIDGVSLAANDRVLVKDQSTASENGLYKVVDGGSWTRTDDLASGVNAAGIFAFIEQGTVNADVGFVCTSNSGSAVVGTNNLAFAQFSGAGTITAGTGITKTGNTLSLTTTSSDAELNILDGATLTTAELNYVDGVTSAIQDQLDSKLTASSTIDGGTY